MRSPALPSLLLAVGGLLDAQTPEAPPVVDRLDQIEQQLQRNAGLEQLAGMFTAIRQDLENEASKANDVVKARCAELRRRVDAAYVEALRAKAVADAVDATSARDLLAYGLYEDVVRQLLGEATAAKDAEALKHWARLDAEVFKASNAIVLAVFDDAYQQRVPWRDLLAGDPARWRMAPSPAVRREFNGNNLVIAHEGDAGAEQAAMTFEPGRSWRDCIIELGFVLDSGSFTVCTRVGDVIDIKRAPGARISKQDADVVAEYRQPFNAQISVIGDKFRVALNGTEVRSETLERERSRKGTIGLAVTAGTSLTISKLRVRVLR